MLLSIQLLCTVTSLLDNLVFQFYHSIVIKKNFTQELVMHGAIFLIHHAYLREYLSYFFSFLIIFYVCKRFFQ